MLAPSSYQIAALILPRLLALVYLFTFFSFLLQVRGLYGKRGILPAERLLGALSEQYGNERFWRCPTLFWLRADDSALTAACLIGIAGSILLLFGFFPPATLFLLTLLYLSLLSIGEDFTSYIWDVFLLEISWTVIFLALTPVPNLFLWISLNFLLFRFHIEVGAVKLQSGDPTWRNLTALQYHYETQPLPNGLAWFAHQLPSTFHNISCGALFALELIVPFGIFGTESMRFATALLLIALQIGIWLTGNFAFLNHLTAFLSVILISDAQFPEALLPAQSAPADPTLALFLSGVGICLTLLQSAQLWHHFFPSRGIQRILSRLAPFSLINRYGLFAVMTTERHEIKIEGSDDGETWKAYGFHWKPGKANERPRRIAPLHPRLDWQCWFLPFRPFHQNFWFQQFLLRLLEGSAPVLRLLKSNPFPNQPPKYLRVLIQRYRFTTAKEKNESGNWWKKEEERAYSPVLEKRSGRAREDR